MQESTPQPSSAQAPPDLGYCAGYTGYCPQLKYHHGRTYSQLTSELMSCPETLSSRQPHLHSGLLPSGTDPRDNTWTSRQGEGRSPERHVPGYTGFVPKSQNYFGRTYAETCYQALRDFRDQRSRQPLQTADWPVRVAAQQEVKRLTTPLTAGSPVLAPYPPPHPWRSLGSPYFMDDHSPHKYFISGFTGHVPKSHYLIGLGYPIATNKALVQFSREMRSDSTSLPVSLPRIPPVYPTKQMPFYTGHVPGYKFMYGQTFGQLTQNALGLSATQSNADARS